MNEALKEKQRIRFQFLNALYEMTDGNTDKLIQGYDVAKKIGLAEKNEKAISAVNFLIGEHLIKDANIVSGPLGVLQITHSGVLEVENAVSRPNQPTQHFMPINVLHVHQMIGSTIQQGTIASTQSVSISLQNSNDISKFVEQLSRAVSDLNLSAETQLELKAEIDTIKTQIGSPRPKTGIVKECMQSIRTILESAAGSAIGAQLALQVPPLLAAMQ